MGRTDFMALERRSRRARAPGSVRAGTRTIASASAVAIVVLRVARFQARRLLGVGEEPDLDERRRHRGAGEDDERRLLDAAVADPLQRVEALLDRARQARRVVEVGDVGEVPEDELHRVGRGAGVLARRRLCRLQVGGVGAHEVRLGAVRPARHRGVGVDRDEHRRLETVGERGALGQRQRLVAVTRETRGDAERRQPRGGEARHRQGDVLLELVVGPLGALVLAAVPGVEDHERAGARRRRPARSARRSPAAARSAAGRRASSCSRPRRRRRGAA